MRAKPAQPYTLPSRSKSTQHEPKLGKEYGRPQHTDRKRYSKTEKKMIEKRNGQLVTKTLRNLSKVQTLKSLALNKIGGKLKINCFKIPNYA